MLEVLQRCFPDEMASPEWQTRLAAMMPSYAQPVGDDVTDDGTATVNVTAPPVTDLAITKDLVDIDQTAGIATFLSAVGGGQIISL